ncbi:MAG: hypothetical protein K6L74_12635 [Neptuniibacter sp.]
MIDHVVLNDLILELRRFYGQGVYSGLTSSISKNKPFIRLSFVLIGFFKKFVLFNFIALCFVLLFFRAFRYAQNNKHIFQYGVTKNNVRAFNKLNDCLSRDIVDNTSLNYRGARFCERLKAVASIGDLFEAARVLSKDCHSDPLVQVRAIIGAASYVLYSICPVAKSVSVLCVASDHSPVAKALVAVFHEKNNKTCYIQHAPVTEYFPPLNTHLSILYDEKTIQIYKRCADKLSQSFEANITLMTPFEEAFKHPELLSNEFTVGICLGRFPEKKRFAPVIDLLLGMEEVGNVVLRQHPACKLDLSYSHKKVALQPVGQDLSEFVKNVDIALVPSSGVAIELLHSGVPTFYVEGLDDLPVDYYGFVEDGILPLLDMNYFPSVGSINSFFGDDWKAKYASYDATVLNSIESMQKNVAVSFQKIVLDIGVS